MPLSVDAWSNYNALYNSSHTARYDGITNLQTFEKLKQNDHDFALENVAYLRKYVIGKGLILS